MRMHLAHYLGLLHRSQHELADALYAVRRAHPDEPDLIGVCERLAGQCGDNARRLEPLVRRYSAHLSEEPERMHSAIFTGARRGRLGLLRDLHDLYLLATQCEISWTLIAHAAEGAGDEELIDVVRRCGAATAAQLLWLRTLMRQIAPQTLIVAS